MPNENYCWTHGYKVRTANIPAHPATTKTEYLVFRVQSYSKEYPGATVHNVYLATDSTPALPK
jgi:hypothetical protein